MSAPKEQSETPARRNRSRRDSAERPAASVNMDELRELIGLLRENGLAELELENEGFRVRLRRDATGSEPAHYAQSSALLPAPARPESAPSPASSGPSHPGTQATTAASQDQDLHII